LEDLLEVFRGAGELYVLQLSLTGAECLFDLFFDGLGSCGARSDP
jgi:hypothetical protein